MWTKPLSPAGATLPSRRPAEPRVAAAPRPTPPVLQSRRVPQQLSFEFQRG